MKQFLFLIFIFILTSFTYGEERKENQKEELRRASLHYKSGMKLYKEGKYIEAKREFYLSYSLSKNADLLYNIARCYERIKDYKNAVKYYERYLKEKVEPPDKEAVEQHIKELKELISYQEKLKKAKKDVGAVQFQIDQKGAKIYIDNKLIGSSPLKKPIKLKKGKYKVKVLKKGYQPFVGELKIYHNITTVAVVKLKKQKIPRVKKLRKGRIWTFISVGLSTMMFLSGIITGSIVNYHYATSSNKTLYESWKEERKYIIISDVSYGLGLFFGLLSVIAYYIEGAYLYEK